MRLQFALLLLLVVLAQCQQVDDDDEFNLPTETTILFTHDQLFDMAEKIMKRMDEAYESHDYKELLNLHYPDMKFSYCQVGGETIEGLKQYLEVDETLKKVKRSKHSIIYNPQNDGVEQLDVHGFRFDYLQYLGLEENQIVRTTGTMIVRTQYGKIEIVKVVEHCPEKIF